MVRVLFLLTFLMGSGVSSFALEAVDFDLLFHAASGQGLPDQPPEEKSPPAQTNATTEKLPAPNALNQSNPFAQPNHLSQPNQLSQPLPPPQPHSIPASPMAPARQTEAPYLPLTSSEPQSPDQFLPLEYKPSAISESPSLSSSPSILEPAQPAKLTGERVDFQAIFNEQPCNRVAPPCGGAGCGCGPRVCTVGDDCMPPRPCCDSGPIRGVNYVGFEQYYRCPDCYRGLWGDYAAERAKHCEKYHKHLQGRCECHGGECCPQQVPMMIGEQNCGNPQR